MRVMVYSLLWAMQDLYHQPYVCVLHDSLLDEHSETPNDHNGNKLPSVLEKALSPDESFILEIWCVQMDCTCWVLFRWLRVESSTS